MTGQVQDFSNKYLSEEEGALVREAYAETYPVRPLLNHIDRLEAALRDLRRDAFGSRKKIIDKVLGSKASTQEWNMVAKSDLEEAENTTRVYADKIDVLQKALNKLEAFAKRVADSDMTGGAPAYVAEARALLRSQADGGTEHGT